MKKKKTVIGSINPNMIKSRDLVHLQEITHGTGCGPHKRKDKKTKHKKKDEPDEERYLLPHLYCINRARLL